MEILNDILIALEEKNERNYSLNTKLKRARLTACPITLRQSFDYSAPCNTFNLFRYSYLALAASSDLAKSSAARSGFARFRAL